MAQANLKISATAETAASECAAFIIESLTQILKSNTRATVAISGGSTPKLLFADLARSGFDWSKVHLFWVDERCVPPTDSQSNYKLAYDTWLSPAHYPAANVHRVFGELTPAEAAKKYVNDIREFFALCDGDIPVFDIVHRGMGPDAHTASLFPGEPLIENRVDIATNVWVEKMKMDRVTLLPGTLLAARKTVLQVSGPDKAAALKDVIEAPEDWLKYPCQIGSRDPNSAWFLDRAAAAKL